MEMFARMTTVRQGSVFTSTTWVRAMMETFVRKKTPARTELAVFQPQRTAMTPMGALKICVTHPHRKVATRFPRTPLLRFAMTTTILAQQMSV